MYQLNTIPDKCA